MSVKKFKQTKYLIVVLILIISVNNSFSQVNSSNVVTHDKVTIVTNPKQGSKSHTLKIGQLLTGTIWIALKSYAAVELTGKILILKLEEC